MRIKPGDAITYEVDVTPRFTYTLWDKYGDVVEKCRSWGIIGALNYFDKRGYEGVKITSSKNPDLEFKFDL